METTQNDDLDETQEESGSEGEGAPAEGGSAGSEAAEHQAEQLRGG